MKILVQTLTITSDKRQIFRTAVIDVRVLATATQDDCGCKRVNSGIATFYAIIQQFTASMRIPPVNWIKLQHTQRPKRKYVRTILELSTMQTNMDSITSSLDDLSMRIIASNEILNGRLKNGWKSQRDTALNLYSILRTAIRFYTQPGVLFGRAGCRRAGAKSADDAFGVIK